MQKLWDIVKDPANKLICVDMDGTLCEGEYWHTGDEKEPAPKEDMIKIVNSLYIKGAHIIIWTARTLEAFSTTHKWLVKHDVKFHGISMQRKCGADLYIDDKCINVQDILNVYENKII
jgi:uncharacterized HAD superfamily protein